jgi:hypothetical protein
MPVELPTEKAVRVALGRLVAHGVDSVWLPDVQPLFKLPAVEEKLAELGEDRAADALRAVLETAVGYLGQSQYRSLLTIVLGLDPAYEHLTAGEKRRIAGQEFRGGERPVSAGTIRQHHEPRALDELAAMLVSARLAEGEDLARDSLELTEAGTLALEWHPSVHREWAGESLVFWGLSVGGYRRRDVLGRIPEAMSRAGVSSWSIYELIGVFDLLIRAWIPAGAREMDVRSELQTALVDRLKLIEVFSVEEVVSSAPWGARDGSLRTPSAEVLSRPPPSSEIDRLNRGDRDVELDHYEALDIVARPKAQRGIGFFVALRLDGHVLSLWDARQSLDRRIIDVVRDARKHISDVSIYKGSGFANFLIHGRARLQRFTSLYPALIEPLSEVAPFADLRVNTFVMSSLFALAQEESMRPVGSPPTERDFAELLEQGEERAVEIKAAAFTEPWAAKARGGAHDSLPWSHRASDQLIAAITSFLNTDDGVVVIGALERSAVERNPDLSESPILRGAPSVGDYLVTGIDHEMDKGRDWYLRRLSAFCADSIVPSAMPFLQIQFEMIGDRTVCVVRVRDVSAAGTWFYCKPHKGETKFVVRADSTITSLEGPSADQYKLAKPRG